jgi:predicted enzyme related to lactoylglutathione lyase
MLSIGRLTSHICCYKSSNDGYSQVGIWIPVTDPVRARNFYSAVLHWDCMDTGSPSPIEGIKETYYFTKGGTLNGCFCLMDEAKIARSADEADKYRVGVHTIFAVKDIEASLDLIEKNGGHRHVDRVSIGPNMGFIARFIDSEGNLMGIYAMK